MNTNRQNFGLTVSSLNYVAGEANAIIAEVIMRGATVDGGHVSLYPAVKDTYELTKMSSSGIVKAYTAAFADAGNITLDPVILAPKKFSVQIQDDWDKLEQTWSANQMRAGMWNTNATPSYADAIERHLVDNASREIDRLIWQGSETSGVGIYGQLNGFIAQAFQDSNATKISGTLTKSNVIDALDSVYSALPSDVYGADLRIFMNPSDMYLYRSALGGIALFNGFGSTADINTLPFADATIVATPGMPKGYIYASHVSNLAYGTDLQSDSAEVRFIDLRETTGDRRFRYRMDFKLDVKHAFGKEVVLYRPAAGTIV